MIWYPNDTFNNTALNNVMGITIRWKNFNYMLEIDILRNSITH